MEFMLPGAKGRAEYTLFAQRTPYNRTGYNLGYNRTLPYPHNPNTANILEIYENNFHGEKVKLNIIP